MTNVLSHVFAVIAREAETNPQVRGRILQALRADTAIDASTPERSKTRPRNRRERAVIDPYLEIAKGEEGLRARLSQLSVEQLKDVVSEYLLDSSRLALKWKSAPRLVELIVTTVRGRLEKGDAFRT
jgi:hypothetical protein